MLPCHLQLTSQNVESTSTYSVVCTHEMNHLLRDFIRLRLAFNFQFEKVLMDFCLNSRRFLISVRTMLQWHYVAKNDILSISLQVTLLVSKLTLFPSIHLISSPEVLELKVLRQKSSFSIQVTIGSFIADLTSISWTSTGISWIQSVWIDGMII